MTGEIRMSSPEPATAGRPMSAWPQAKKGLEHSDSQHTARLITRFLPISADAPAMAREMLANLPDMLALGLVRDAQLLVSELVTYRVRRLPKERDGMVRLDVSMSGIGVRVQVTDDDRGSTAPPVDSDEPAFSWELQVVAEIADRWGIRRNGLTTFWFELDR